MEGAADTDSAALARSSDWAGVDAATLLLRTAESERVRLGAKEAAPALPALDKALRLANANARPLDPCALLCCAMTSPDLMIDRLLFPAQVGIAAQAGLAGPEVALRHDPR
jgi:hypothetical protein